ncbi:uncharacterized protein LOC122251865 [Penaeus japonicus]|uniref:uncharacterized protein LOC122251865 n=1 Tax=Penaeus japonicus TaxID=27405 RepID=UPI001C714A5A|nr:uncharacterized protein LOC122251865 [Penaeus japonicus]
MCYGGLSTTEDATGQLRPQVTGHLAVPVAVCRPGHVAGSQPSSGTEEEEEEEEKYRGTYDVLHSTRLELLNGRLPYLPCKIRHYPPGDIRTCLASLRPRGRLWIAFVGDSKARVRFDQLLTSTGRDWEITMAGQHIPWKNYTAMIANKVQATIDAKSESLNLRTTVIWASRGMATGASKNLRPTEMVHEWMAAGAVVPDIVVIGFGRWVFRDAFAESLPSLSAPDDVGLRWKAMWPLIRHLATRSHVLLMPQTRNRYHYDIEHTRDK